MNPDLTVLLPIALQAIEIGEAHVRTHPPTGITPKGDRDMITDVDLAVERMIGEFLAQATPAIGFLGEEHGGADESTCWVLDPLDGTANFTRGLPLNGISPAPPHETSSHWPCTLTWHPASSACACWAPPPWTWPGSPTAHSDQIEHISSRAIPDDTWHQLEANLGVDHHNTHRFPAARRTCALRRLAVLWKQRHQREQEFTVQLHRVRQLQR